MQRSTLSWPHYATCLWPGLADVWWRGRLSALPTAIIFGLVLNGLLTVRYVYPGWLGGGLVRIAFWVGLLAWTFWVFRSVRELPSQLVPREASEVPDRFSEAHAAFLAGEWTLAEKYLTETLEVEPRDPPALLMLCGVYRQTERFESAEILLEEIEKTEVADPWWLEVAAEKQRLRRRTEAPIPAV